jgi:hypothetical protein
VADFFIRHEGTISLLFPESEAARDWVEAHLPDDALTWASAVCIEHRYVPDILAGIVTDGLTIES